MQKLKKNNIESNYQVYEIISLLFTGSSTFCVLAEKVALRVTNLIKRDMYDIVKLEWFHRCIEGGTWVPW